MEMFWYWIAQFCAGAALLAHALPRQQLLQMYNKAWCDGQEGKGSSGKDTTRKQWASMPAGRPAGVCGSKYPTKQREGIPGWGEAKEGMKQGDIECPEGSSGPETEGAVQALGTVADAATKSYPPSCTSEPDMGLLGAAPANAAPSRPIGAAGN